MRSLYKRVLVSFDGLCPYHCKHCYTLELSQMSINRNMKDIVDSISDNDFDVVYVSQKNENFYDPDQGILLCEGLFERYKCDVFMITRNIFSAQQQQRLRTLQMRMKERSNDLFLGVSIPAMTSWLITESDAVPHPQERIGFLKEMYNIGIPSLLIIRPLYPNNIIPISELLCMIDSFKGNISSVVSSGLILNQKIISRLGLAWEDFRFLPTDNSEYLVGSGIDEKELKYVDVSSEIELLSEKCISSGIPFFRHTMPALSYIKSLPDL